MPQNTTTEIGRAAHSIAETCAITGIGRDTVYAAIRDGRLVARKLGRRTIVTDDDLRLLAALPRIGGHERAAQRSRARNCRHCRRTGGEGSAADHAPRHRLHAGSYPQVRGARSARRPTRHGRPAADRGAGPA